MSDTPPTGCTKYVNYRQVAKLIDTAGELLDLAIPMLPTYGDTHDLLQTANHHITLAYSAAIQAARRAGQ